MSKSIVLIGAGGHSRSVIALLNNNGFTVKGIYDDSWRPGSNEKIMSVPVLGNVNAVPQGENVVLSIGDSKIRENLFTHYLESIYHETIKHPNAFIEPGVVFKRANLVFGNAFLNAEVKIGDNNILNTGCIIEHECVIGDHNHISVSSVLCGRVSVGNNCFIGAGAIVKDKVKICDNVVIGAGAVVINDITVPGVYAGNPSKKIK